MIKYDKLFRLLSEKGYNTTRIRKDNLIGQRTLYALKNGTGGINHQTIDNLCRVLNCQPGDIMEYVEDDEDIKWHNRRSKTPPILRMAFFMPCVLPSTNQRFSSRKRYWSWPRIRQVYRIPQPPALRLAVWRTSKTLSILNSLPSSH